MIEEIAAAVLFLTGIVKKNEKLDKNQLESFSDRLTKALLERFRHHWYMDIPNKGQAYRCIRINPTRSDPLLKRVAEESGLKYEELKLPLELTLWVDPGEVTCRFGESKGTYCSVASFSKNNKNAVVDRGSPIDGLSKDRKTIQNSTRMASTDVETPNIYHMGYHHHVPMMKQQQQQHHHLQQPQQFRPVQQLYLVNATMVAS